MWRMIVTLCVAVGSLNAAITKRSFCGSDSLLTTNNGVINSHSGLAHNHTYGKNMDCSWTIEAPEGMKIELVAKAFDLEADSTCDYDYLQLFDAKDTTSNSLGKFCGASFNPITSTGRFMTLRFVSDGDTQSTGFQMFYNFTTLDVRVCSSSQFQCANSRCVPSNYRCDNADDCGDDSDETNCQNYVKPTNASSVCAADEYNCHTSSGGCISRDWLCDGDDDCGNGVDELLSTCMAQITNSASCGTRVRSGMSGSITSPNYPNNYGPSTHCIYNIQVPPGYSGISFKFESAFNVEPDSTCDYDYVLVTANTQSNNGKMCGATAPAPFTIRSDHAYVQFKTDDSDEYKGFRLDWNALE